MKKRGRNKFSLCSFVKNNRGIISDYLPWLLIGLAILAIVMISIFVLRGAGSSFIDKIKNLFQTG